MKKENKKRENHMLKFYDCKVCQTECVSLISDGEIYEKEVCSPECLAQLSVNSTKVLLQTTAK